MRSSELTRRRLLRRAGEVAGTAALLSGSGAVDALAGTSRRIAPSQWRRLARAVHGRLLLPGDRGFERFALPYNHRYADIRPAGIVACTTARDVQAAVRWATTNGVPVVPRAGGHSYAGYSTTRGLLVTVKPMRAVEVDDAGATAIVAAGARNVDIYDALQPHEMAISAGRCPSVGVSGLVLGGGFGFSSRRLGLTCDALLETEIVTADGALHRCSATENPDLFWALRGAGGGNLGINTSFTFRTDPVTNVTLYDLRWSFADAPQVMAALQAVLMGAPNTLSCRMGAGNTGRRGGNPTFGALGQYFGPPDELRAILAPAFAAAAPQQELLESRTFWEAKTYFFHSTPKGQFAVKSAFLDEPLGPNGVETLLSWIARWPGSRNDDGGGAAIFAWGGAVAGPAPTDTAFVHRGPAFLMAMDTSWTARDSARTAAANRRWLQGLGAAMAPYASGAAYQNFIDPTQRDPLGAYYGANLERLVTVKRAVDPSNVFTYPGAIPTRL